MRQAIITAVWAQRTNRRPQSVRERIPEPEPLVFHPGGSCRRARRAGSARAVEGDVLFDRASRGRYATDASIYQVEPIGVLVPRIRRRRARGVRRLPRAARAGAAARRRQLAVRADGRRRAGHRSQQASQSRRRVRSRRDDGRPSSPASCSTRSTPGSSRTACGFRSTSARRRRRRSAAWPATTRAARARSPTATWCTTCTRSTRCSPTAPRRASARQREMERRAAARARARATRLRAIGERERDEIERSVPKVLRRVGGYNIDVFHPQSERPVHAGRQRQLRAPAGRQRRHARVDARAHAEARAAAGASHARRRQFPDALPRDGMRARHRRARAVGGRAGRPDDDRSRARQSGVSAGDRRAR